MTNPTDEEAFEVSYDALVDVLYLTKTTDPATHCVEDRDGKVWRYGSDGSLIGVTIVDFAEQLFAGRASASPAVGVEEIAEILMNYGDVASTSTGMDCARRILSLLNRGETAHPHERWGR